MECYSGEGRGAVWRPLAPYMHTKFEVSSFRHSADTRVIMHRITESLTEQQTSPPDCILLPLPIQAGGGIKIWRIRD